MAFLTKDGLGRGRLILRNNDHFQEHNTGQENQNAKYQTHGLREKKGETRQKTGMAGKKERCVETTF